MNFCEHNRIGCCRKGKGRESQKHFSVENVKLQGSKGTPIFFLASMRSRCPSKHHCNRMDQTAGIFQDPELWVSVVQTARIRQGTWKGERKSG